MPAAKGSAHTPLKQVPKIVATFFSASSQGQRKHSARTKINAVNNKGYEEIQPFIHSCVALGSSLMSQYGPSGNERMGDLNEEEFEKNLNTFIDTTECLLKDGNE